VKRHNTTCTSVAKPELLSRKTCLACVSVVEYGKRNCYPIPIWYAGWRHLHSYTHSD